MKDSYQSFNNKADLYSKNRPSYSENFIKCLKEQLKFSSNSICADIGAGTGKLTEILLNNFNTVYAIEPNTQMLEKCKNNLSNYSNVIFKNDSAELIHVRDNSFDFITVAQAFHLFNSKTVCKEFKRILKPNGKVIIVYNMKNHNSKLFLENEMVLKKYCPSYNRNTHATKFTPDYFKDIYTPESYNCKIYTFDNTEYINCNTFINRTLSASYSITKEHPNYNSYINELENVFINNAKNNKVKMDLSTVIYYGILR